MKRIFLTLFAALMFAAAFAACSDGAADADGGGRDDDDTEAPAPADKLPAQTPDSDKGDKGDKGDGDDEGGEREDDDMTMNITIRIGGAEFAAVLDDTATGRAFARLLPVTLDMTELNGNEKYFNLDTSLPTASYSPGTIHAGDLMLWGSDCVVLFYQTFSSGYSYTRIGRVDNPEGLAQAVGRGNIEVTFE